MKVFISWSGDRSRQVAGLLSEWLQLVIQASQPWISTRDISRGALWFTEINERLAEISIGIVCITQENKDRPWILFEAGALAKGLTTSRVCPLLIDLTSADLEPPLSQFNHTLKTPDSMWELVRTLNSCAGDRALQERVLREAFETYWPRFETGFNKAVAETEPPAPAPAKSGDDMLREILGAVKSLSGRIGTLERQAALPQVVLSSGTPERASTAFTVFGNPMSVSAEAGRGLLDLVGEPPSSASGITVGIKTSGKAK